MIFDENAAVNVLLVIMQLIHSRNATSLFRPDLYVCSQYKFLAAFNDHAIARVAIVWNVYLSYAVYNIIDSTGYMAMLCKFIVRILGKVNGIA